MRPFQGLTVRVIAGYDQLPADIRQAMYLLIGHYYENRLRSQVGVRFDAVLPLGVADLLAPYTIVQLV